jgi:hypothetical protein
MVKTHLVWASGKRILYHHKEDGEAVGGVMLAEALDVVVATRMTGCKMTGVVRVTVEDMVVVVVRGSKMEGHAHSPAGGMGVHAWSA